MIDKKTVLSRLEAALKIMMDCGTKNESLEQEYNRLVSEIEAYKFRVLMTGAFSAGKSAFLNTLMDRTILKEGQGPETTIATELVYGQDEYVEAVDNQGVSKRFPLETETVFLPKDWRYLVYHVNCKFLQENPEIVLVDMPGLDSNIEWHNRAIAQYISRGSAFLLFVSCEDGTLRKSVADFLKEKASYPQGIACFVSKSNLRTKPLVEEVCKQVAQEIAQIYGTSIPVDSISYDDPQFRQKAQKAMLYFNAQLLFEKKFSGRVNAFITLCKSILETAKKSEKLDVADLDREIEKLAENEKELQAQLEKEKIQTKRKYDQTVLPAIQQELEQALSMRVDQLTTAMTVSPEAFSSAANSIIRSVLYKSTQQHIEKSFNELIDQFDFTFLEESDNTALKDAMQEGLRMVITDLEDLRQSSAKKSESATQYKQLYQGVAAAVAIATNVVNPLIELVIVFLPTIMELFSGFNRQAKYDELRNKVQAVVIPQIIEKLQPELRHAVENVRDSVLTELTNKAKSVLDTQQAALQDCKCKKEQREQNFHAVCMKYDDALRALEEYRM